MNEQCFAEGGLRKSGFAVMASIAQRAFTFLEIAAGETDDLFHAHCRFKGVLFDKELCAQVLVFVACHMKIGGDFGFVHECATVWKGSAMCEAHELLMSSSRTRFHETTWILEVGEPCLGPSLGAPVRRDTTWVENQS